MPGSPSSPTPHHDLITGLFKLYDEIALPAFQHVAAETKADGTVVTQVDRETSDKLSAILKRHTPDYGIISEEEAEPHLPDAEWQWVMDPLDGTASFTRGYPVWGLGLGLMHRNQPVEGYLHFPVIGESYRHDGRGFTFNGGSVPPLEDTALPDTRNVLLDSSLHKRLETFAPFQDYKIRIFGSNLYHMAAMAMGRAEVMVCGRMKIWDVVAALPMTRAQGLVECHVDGSPLDLSAMTVENGFRTGEPLVIGPREKVNRLVEALNGNT